MAPIERHALRGGGRRPGAVRRGVGDALRRRRVWPEVACARGAARPDPSDVIARARERVRRTGTRVDVEVILAARDAERP